MSETNKSCITINCGCCGADGNLSELDTVLYDDIINSVGNYMLINEIDKYRDIIIVHRSRPNTSIQCSIFPVMYLEEKNIVCYGNGAENRNVVFSIKGNLFEVNSVEDSYEIVKIIGRNY